MLAALVQAKVEGAHRLIPQQLVGGLVQHDFAANKRFNGKAAINWTIDPNNFVYAFVATGSKAGGLNGSNLFNVVPRSFEPEDVKNLF